ncbi:GNAT family N-acetyltransferase [Streptomyces radicis]|uniref:N-acetyltransferase n=1 Tax=Streptomyces radicis TaxID=1750517 RepID=A0A3A9WF06_9ACTN|nr:GNAT family N-acetyltransferase [Streptomyces radicis]RKN11595.1 N-acetyltransferase [Streptomyces radicis]RKN26386.1 N-acetyltransferase [Streptomyces radicis]
METDRLRLRPFTGDDGDVLAALHGDPAVMRHIDNGRPVPRDVVRAEQLPALLAEYRALPPGLGALAAEERDGGAFVGWFALRPAVTRGLTGGTELGYRLMPRAWGRGLATEGARAVVGAAFAAHPSVTRVVATTMTVNAASRRVLEKTGLRLVRTFFEDWPEPIQGAEHGDVEYAVSRAEWARQRRSRRELR